MTIKQAMAAEFTEVSLDDMEKFLKRSFRVLRPKRVTDRGEVVYVLHLGKFVGVKILTSIRPGSGVGADVGQDAIRVGLISLKDGGPLERLKNGKFPIVKRTQNWRDSLKDRIEDCIETYEDKEDYWEQWAETRNKSKPSTSIPKETEEDYDDIDERKHDQGFKAPHPADLQRLEAYLKNMTKATWVSYGLARLTGLDDVPKDLSVFDAKMVDAMIKDLLAAWKSQQTQKDLKQYDPDRMRGDITPPQAKFLRVLLRGITQSEWNAISGENITGRENPPDWKGVESLTKGQASKLIDALKSRGGRRYADAMTEMWKR